MDPVTHKRMRSAHAQRSTTCTCGRVLYGNGHLTHQRACETHLRDKGWPLPQDLRQAIRDEYRHRDVDQLAVVRGVETRLGAIMLNRRANGDTARFDMPWRHFMELVWHNADQAAAELRGQASE